MNFNNNTLLVVLIILSIGFLACQIIMSSTNENFIVLLKEVIIPKNCPDYLYYNGSAYYLFRSRQLFDKNNPKRFNSYDEVKKYWENEGKKCPKLQVTNIVKSKTGGDPTIEYRNECNKKIARPNYDINRCMYYAKTLKDVKDYQSIYDKENIQKYIDPDECIEDTINKENTSMLEKHDIEFKNDLANIY